MPLNVIEFKKSLEKQLPKAFAYIAPATAQARFNTLKKSLIKSFDIHPVTLEIEAGADDPLGAENTTKTLDGKGNLFTFIGFENGDRPTEVIRHALEEFIVMSKRPISTTMKGNRILFNFSVNIPTFEELASLTPMPWEGGRSWIVGVERGISGFGAYIYWLNAGRSLGGLEAKKRNGQLAKLRDGAYRPIPYISSILRSFAILFK